MYTCTVNLFFVQLSIFAIALVYAFELHSVITQRENCIITVCNCIIKGIKCFQTRACAACPKIKFYYIFDFDCKFLELFSLTNGRAFIYSCTWKMVKFINKLKYIFQLKLYTGIFLFKFNYKETIIFINITFLFLEDLMK